MIILKNHGGFDKIALISEYGSGVQGLSYKNLNRHEEIGLFLYDFMEEVNRIFDNFHKTKDAEKKWYGHVVSKIIGRNLFVATFQEGVITLYLNGKSMYFGMRDMEELIEAYQKESEK